MVPKIYFAFVGTPFGFLLGVVTQIAYDNWKEKQQALEMYDARGYMLQPVPGSPNRMSITIGPVYPGDTKQLTLALYPYSVEIIGEIQIDGVTKSCSENNALYQRYREALDKWNAALSNIHTATPADIAQLSKMQNITTLPRK
jgi:hypothetical protein